MNMKIKIEHSLYIILMSIVNLLIHSKLIETYYQYSNLEFLGTIYKHIGLWYTTVETIFLSFISSVIISIIIILLFNKVTKVSILFISAPVFLFYLSLIEDSKNPLPYISSAAISSLVLFYMYKLLSSKVSSPLKYTFDFNYNNNKLNTYLNIIISIFLIITVFIFIAYSSGYSKMINRETFPYLNILLLIEIILLYKLRFNPNIKVALAASPMLLAIIFMAYELVPILITAHLLY